jgi:hypothetical protein
MRNYLKMQVMVWQDGGGNYYYAWGGTDEQLLEIVMMKEQKAMEGEGFIGPFVRTPPVEVWWLLDQENFAKILNGAFELTSFQNWLLISQLSGYNSEFSYFPLLFTDITRVEVEGSPRKTWSHGH